MKRRVFISTLTIGAAGTVAGRLLGRTQPAQIAGTNDGGATKKPRRVNSWKRQPATTVEKVALAYPPSDCEQWLLAFAYAESNPDRVIIGQDMGGIWFSPSAGRKWFTLPNEGLGPNNIQSLAIDPLDERRWLAMCNKRSRGTRQGLYLTTDGGISWRRVFSWERGGETWQHCRRIAFAPSSKNPARACTMRWYAAWDSAVVRYESKYQGIPGLVMSDDGGLNWSLIRDLPEATFGRLINGLRVHPTNPDILYGWGQKGLFRFGAAPDKSARVTFLSGTGGLPAGSCIGHLYLSPDGETLIISVQRQGIYKSVNGGATWSCLYAWEHILSVSVNEGHPDTIYALSAVPGLRGEQARATHDGGRTWLTDAVVEVMPGEERSTWTAQVGGETKCFLFADPRDPMKALAQGRARWFRTENGGRNWVPANDYFAGNQFTPYSSPQIFDPTNPLRYMIPMLDIGAVYTEDGGKTLLRCKLDRPALGLTQGSSKAGAMHPDPRKQTLLLCAGSYSSGRLIRSADNGQTWRVVREANRRRPFIGFDAHEPDYCYQSNERSHDGGATWAELSALPTGIIITGVSATATEGRSVLYAVDMDKVGETEGSFRQVWKSTDRGDTWVKAIQADFALNASGWHTVFRIHPRNPHLVFTRAPTRSSAQIRVWDTTIPAQPAYQDLAVLGATPVPEDLQLVNLAVDPANPEVMYVLLDSDYIGYRVCMSTNRGVAWQDITAGLTFCTERSGLEVHPTTGVVYIGSGAGMFVRKPPYHVPTAQNTWDILDQAFPHWEESHLFEPYAG